MSAGAVMLGQTPVGMIAFMYPLPQVTLWSPAIRRLLRVMSNTVRWESRSTLSAAESVWNSPAQLMNRSVPTAV